MAQFNKFTWDSLINRTIDRIKNDPELTLLTLQQQLESELADRKAQIEGAIDGSRGWSCG
jgi:hypothetical protein